jgi:N-acetylglucosamine kinase-like BadF-type ATPase
MDLYLGADVGNTKSIALIARRNGTIIGWGRGGCGDIYNADTTSPRKSVLKAMQNVNYAVQGALRTAGCSEADITNAVFSMAGADWPEDFSVIEAALKQRDYAGRIEVVNDAVGALRAGAVDNWGVAIANGTGAAISARSPQGLLWHASWWQQGGGGRALGLSALQAVWRSELGIIEKTGLSERILAFYGMNSAEELLYHFTKREGVRLGNIPGLARTVLDLAEEGDATAGAIVRDEGTNLGDYALAAARKVGIANMPFPLVLVGSVFRHDSPILTNAILDRVHSQCSGVTVLKSELEPSAGALVMALEGVGVRVRSKIRARLKESAPPPEFFAT